MDQAEKELIEQITRQYETNQIQYGSLYILPDGKLLYLGDSGYGHSDLAEFLKSKGVEKQYSPGKASPFLRSLGWIRVNTKLKFVDLVDIKPTPIQYEKLLEALDYMKDDIQITVKGGFKVYKGKTSDEIIKLIKRFYSSGTLYESIQ